MIHYYAFPGLFGSVNTATTPEGIAKRVAAHYGMSVDQLKEKTRRREIVECRQVCIYIIRYSHPLFGLKSLGRMFGGKDHTTMIHSIRTVQNRVDTEQDFSELIDTLSPISFKKPSSAKVRIHHTLN